MARITPLSPTLNMCDKKHAWLAIQQTCLSDTQSRAKQRSELKAAEGIALQKDKIYCPQIHFGVLI